MHAGMSAWVFTLVLSLLRHRLDVRGFCVLVVGLGLLLVLFVEGRSGFPLVVDHAQQADVLTVLGLRTCTQDMARCGPLSGVHVLVGERQCQMSYSRLAPCTHMAETWSAGYAQGIAMDAASIPSPHRNKARV